MSRSSSHHLIICGLALAWCAACGSRSDIGSPRDNQWSVDDPDMSAPDMARAGLDMTQARPDMTPLIIDDMSPPAQDMSPPVQDMETLEDQPIDTPDLPADMPPRACANQELERITLGELVSGNLPAGRSQAVDYEHCPSITPRFATSYILEVEQETVVDIWTTYLNGETTVSPPVLLLADGCEPLVEEDFIGCSRAPGDDEEGRQASIRQRLVPGEYILTIAERTTRFFDADGGDYIIHVDEVLELEENGTCERAEALTPNAPLYNELSSGIGDRGKTSSCFEGKNLVYYTLEVPPRHGVGLEAAYTAPVRDIFIRVDQGCSRTPESFCEQRRWINGQERVTWANETDSTQEYTIALDIDQRLPFNLLNTVTPLADNAWCEDALPVELDTSSPVQDWTAAGPRETMCFTTDRRRSLYYSITVPDQHRLHMYGTGASLRTGCGDVATQCIRQPYINRSGQPEDLIVMTSQRDFTGGTSQITPVAIPLATHSACAAPAAIDPTGAPLVNQDIRSGSESFNACTIVFTEGQPTLYYSLAMPLGGPNYRVVATANDPAQHDTLSLQVLQRADDPSQCYTGTCQTSSDAYFRGQTPAEVIITPDFGGGRDPIPVLIAVTMNAPFDMADPGFSIYAEPVAP